MKNQKTTTVEHLQIDADQAGQRIDNFLLRHLKGVPKSVIYRILRKGEVRVNKGRIKPHYKLQDGDTLRVPPVKIPEKDDPATPKKYAIEQIKNAVLYEDDRLIAINKPPGMAVHGGSGLSSAVIETLRHWRSDLHYLELVHRLDRDTSGCLLIAKKRSALRQLHELLRESRINKKYIAIVKGKWKGGRKRIDAPLYKNTLRSGERVVRVDEQGKHAISHFKPVKVANKYSVVEISIETGRTHQIRVHAAHIGHPIAGDEKYGDEEFNQFMKSKRLKRLFLHARSLEFSLQNPTKQYQLIAPFDEQFQIMFDELNLDF